MRDQNRGFSLNQFVKFRINFVFCVWVKGSGRFIQNTDFAIIIQSACDGNLLCFSSGGIKAVRGDIFVNLCVFSMGKRVYQGIQIAAMICNRTKCEKKNFKEQRAPMDFRR